MTEKYQRAIDQRDTKLGISGEVVLDKQGC